MTRNRLALLAVALVVGALVLAVFVSSSDETRRGGRTEPRKAFESATSPTSASDASQPTSSRVLIRATIVVDDDEGSPAAGAWVRVVRDVEGEFLGSGRLRFERDILREPGPPFAEAITDAAGEAELSLPGDVDWQISCGRRDLAPEVVTWDGAETEVTLALTRVVPVPVKVMDEQRRPIRDAEVLLSGSPPVPVARSDAAGDVSLAIDGHAHYFIRREGYATTSADGSNLAETRRVVLRPGLTLAGVVVDREGAPIAQANLALREDDFESRRLSGGNGRFEFRGIPANRTWCDAMAELQVQKEGFVPADISAVPGDRDLRVTLDRPGAISGRAIFPDGSPAAVIEVLLSHGFRGGGWTDPEGFFRVDGIPPGRVHLMARVWRPHPARPAHKVRTHRAERMVVVTPGEPLEEVTLVLEPVPSSFLAIACVGPNRTPLGELPWTGFRSEFGHVAIGFGTKPRVTSYPFPAATPVRVKIFASQVDGFPAGLGIIRRTLHTVPSPLDPPTVIRLPGPSRFTVRVRDAEGERLPGPTSVHVSREGGDPEFPGEELRPGDHAFPVPPGLNLLVVADAPGCGPEYRWHLKAEAPDTLEVRLREEGRLRGRLVGAGVGRVRHMVVHEEKKFWGLTLEPAPDGRFELAPVPARRLFVAIAGDTGETLIRVVDVTPGADVDLGEIDVDALPRLTGRVTDDSGQPVAALVTLWSRKGYERIESVATDREGHFDLPYTAIPDGWVEVSARGKGRVFHAATSNLTNPLAVRLGSEGRLRVTLEPELCWPDRPHLRATLPDGVTTWKPPIEKAVDSEGRPCFVLRELPAGPLRITCVSWKRSVRTVIGEIDLRIVAGETHVETMAIRPR